MKWPFNLKQVHLVLPGFPVVFKRNSLDILTFSKVAKPWFTRPIVLFSLRNLHDFVSLQNLLHGRRSRGLHRRYQQCAQIFRKVRFLYLTFWWATWVHMLLWLNGSCEYQLQCAVVITLPTPFKIIIIDTHSSPWGRAIWGVCCEFEIRFTFCCCHRSVVCNVVINWTALWRHSTVFWKVTLEAFGMCVCHWLVGNSLLQVIMTTEIENLWCKSSDMTRN